MARLRAWVQASRPILQIGVAVPLIYGQALAFAVHGAFATRLAALAFAYGIFAQMFIAYANDIADADTDAKNVTFSRFSGGSRVIPEGKLALFDLAKAATLAFLAMAAVSVFLVFREQRLWMVVLAAITAHLTWMYGFAPFRLSYRGLGEVAHGLGMGVLLPVVGYYVQAGTLEGIGPRTLFPSFLLGFAANVTTALPDAPADAASGKHTLAVRRGERGARSTSLALIAIAALSTTLAVPGAGLATWLAVSALGVALALRSYPLLAKADAANRELCARFTARNVAAIVAVYFAWSVAAVASRLL